MSTISIVLYLLLSGTRIAAAPLIKRKGGPFGAGRGGSSGPLASSGSVSAGSLSSEQWSVVKFAFIAIGALCVPIIAAYIGYKCCLRRVRRPETKRPTKHYMQETRFTPTTKYWMYVVTIDQGKSVIRIPERAYWR